MEKRRKNNESGISNRAKTTIGGSKFMKSIDDIDNNENSDGQYNNLLKEYEFKRKNAKYGEFEENKNWKVRNQSKQSYV